MASPTAPVRYDYLDALRGWAILGVVTIHAQALTGKVFPGSDVAAAGRYGVQLFFVVSAFTIFLTLDRARERGAVDWTGFFLRRFFRVLPMFWVGLALYAFVPGREDTVSVMHYGPLDYMVTALLLHGWQVGLINALVPGGWSIAAEATFYLVVPWCHRSVRGWQGAAWLLLGTLALSHEASGFLKMAGARGYLGTGYPAYAAQYAYYWFPSQFPAFACGVLAYYLARSWSARTVDRATGLALLAVAAVALQTAFGFGIHGWLLEPICFALAFVPLVLGLQAWPAAWLVNPAMGFLGRISYSVYLLHFAVLRLALNSLDTFLPEPWQHGFTAFALLGAATLAGTVGPAWLAYRWVEQPCIDLGGRLVRRLAAARAGHRAAGTAGRLDAPMVALPRGW